MQITLCVLTAGKHKQDHVVKKNMKIGCSARKEVVHFVAVWLLTINQNMLSAHSILISVISNLY